MSIAFHEEYQGYRISFQRNDRFAWIFAPGENRAMNEIPQAEKSGSRDQLRVMARAIIDAELVERSK